MLETLEPLQRLTRDLRAAHVTLSVDEARFLVDAYYAMQEDRKRAGNQVRALSASGEPNEVIQWLAGNTATLERNIQTVLDAWSLTHAAGRWARSVVGIGPVLASGLLAHIDVALAPTVGHVWRFAGLDPTVSWSKGQKRPWNAGLKVVCWKIGQSFMKFQNHENDIYGRIYVERKALENERNDAGAFLDQAVAALAAKRYGKETAAYAAYNDGRLPPAQIDARARRYATKLFLAHYHAVAYEVHFGEPPPKPYVVAILGHAHYIGPPGWPMA